MPTKRILSPTRSPTPSGISTVAADWFSRRDAGLSASEECEFQHWLAADSRHGIALAEFEAAWSVFGKPGRTGAVDELERELSIRSARRSRLHFGVIATAFALLVTVGAFWRTSPQGETKGVLNLTAVILSPERRLLSDGSVVLMKEGSRITESFTAGMRRVKLESGEAMFEVAPDHTRPFVVSAGGVEVRAVGTAFAVELGASTVEVLIAEGTVAIAKPAPGKNPPADVSLHGSPQSAAVVEAGHRVVFAIAPSEPVPTVIPVTATELGERLAWRNRRVEFSGTVLAEAIGVMNREASHQSGQTLVIEDPSINTMRISGIFQTDSTEAFVVLLEAGFGLSAERAGREVRLRRADQASGRR